MPAEGPESPADLLDQPRVQARRPAGPGRVGRLFGLPVGVQADPEVRVQGVAHTAPLPLQAHPRREIAGLQQDGRKAGQVRDPLVLPGHHEPGQPRMERQGGHAPSPARDAALPVQGAQAFQQPLGRGHGFGRRRLEPREGTRGLDSHGVQDQHGLRQVGPEEFREVLGGTGLEFGLGIQAQAGARPRASRPAGPLQAARLADARRAQPRQARPGGMDRLPPQPGIDDGGHALEGHGAFRHVGAEDHLGLCRDGHRLLLRLEREAPVQGHELQAATGRGIRARRQALADLGGTRQEDQGMPRGALPAELRQGLVHAHGQGPVVEMPGPEDRHGMEPPFALDPLGLEIGDHRVCLQGGAHDQEAEAGAQPLEAPQQGQGQVRVHVPLVELVQDHHGDPREPGVLLEAPQQQSLGNEAHARLPRDLLLEPHGVADAAPQVLPQFLRHARGGEPGRQAARLEDPAFPGIQQARLQQGPRHPGRLARPRLRLEDQVPARTDGLDDPRQEGVDGKRLARGHGHASRISR